MISVIVITKNEAAVIEACMESISWADEIIVVDSGSTDGTLEICRRYTEHVVDTDWPGFGIQKNRALDLATGDWVLAVDADERVSPQLRAELERIMDDPQSGSVYQLPHLSSFCGREMKHSGYWPDHVLRFFRRESARFSEDLIHEKLQTSEEILTLTEPLHHLAYRDLAQVQQKVNSYSTTTAQMLYERGKKGGILPALVHGWWSFLTSYVFRAGFLDGRQGFLLAVSKAETSYYKYVKLMLMHEQQQLVPQAKSAATNSTTVKKAA